LGYRLAVVEGVGSDSQLPYGGGNQTLHIGKAPLGHALENVEERFPESMMLETGKEAEQQSYKEALASPARPHPSLSNAIL
jgi:hypothetical protein